MCDPQLHAIVDAASVERLDAHLDFFSTIRRDNGGPGEAAAVDHIVRSLEADGIEVRMHEFDA